MMTKLLLWSSLARSQSARNDDSKNDKEWQQEHIWVMSSGLQLTGNDDGDKENDNNDAKEWQKQQQT